jgi:dGTPase
MKMTWEKLLSAKRWGYEHYILKDSDDARSQFQIDYDRLIFSSPFRRLQNKTQVFPLPGSVFVHNRLTHSLEVASVGRSLGRIFYNQCKQADPAIDQKLPLMSEIGNVVAAAALAHDLGNPPFGHSGEAAISRYFTDGDGLRFLNQLPDEQRKDFTHFEGNANAIRILTHPFEGKGNGAYALTYATLGAIAKYPCESSIGHEKTQLHRKKYGFFQSEKDVFAKIAAEMGMLVDSQSPLSYFRHPLTFLVEAADDICYGIIDLEDAHRLHILSFDEVKSLLLPLCNSDTLVARLDSELSDNDAKVSLLRAKAISNMIAECSKVFYEQQDAILSGSFNQSLIKSLSPIHQQAWKKIEDVSVKRIYNYSSVIQKEVSGYKVMAGLLEEFVPALVSNDTHYYQKLVKLIPSQYQSPQADLYSRIQSVLDFASGMTDLYAVELYGKIKGISFPSLS